MARKKNNTFVCQNCGQSYPKWQGQCATCGEWNTLIEEFDEPARDGTIKFKTTAGIDHGICQSLDAIESERTARIPSGIDSFDDLIGGGIVPGGITLIGGEPGVGKSTFMMQLASRLAVNLKPIVYISGEESLTQIKLRANRLRVANEKDIFLISEQNLESSLSCVLSCLPKLLIVDSIQTVFTPHLESAPGSVAQVRESAAAITKFGKDRGLPVFIIGHVTKEGAIAGPKVLEHIVDSVLYFEGELTSQFRILRVFKNRFGSTGEVVVFQMTEKGLLPVLNPSDLFVNRNRENSPGVSIVSLLEGSRAILAELQTLVTQSFLSMPRRVVSGLDSNRLNLVLAVLEKHAGFKFYNKDVFANVAGGLRLGEPGGDLGLALALVASIRDLSIPRDLLPIGELTLSGEIRPVSGIERRVSEGKRFGFSRFLLPENSEFNDLSLKILKVKTIKEAIEVVFPATDNS
ncbi:MAG: DNA repair protein RadA [Candidatus Riflebacteria bacterium]|nr:DNA repair protein RadA [Candidatus Riflebacteria bacterium]